MTFFNVRPSTEQVATDLEVIFIENDKILFVLSITNKFIESRPVNCDYTLQKYQYRRKKVQEGNICQIWSDSNLGTTIKCFHFASTNCTKSTVLLI